MEAKELRIGNYVTAKDGKVYKIYELKEHDQDDEYKILAWGIGRNRAFGKSEEQIKPIPLTEEWLLKFGFEKDDEYLKGHHYYSVSLFDYKYLFAYAYFRNDWGFYQEYTDSPFETDDGKKHFISCGIRYVHQLQNLFFALTGKELTLTK